MDLRTKSHTSMLILLTALPLFVRAQTSQCVSIGLAKGMTNLSVSLHCEHVDDSCFTYYYNTNTEFFEAVGYCRNLALGCFDQTKNEIGSDSKAIFKCKID